MLEYHVENSSLWHFDGLLSLGIAKLENRTNMIMIRLMMNSSADIGYVAAGSMSSVEQCACSHDRKIKHYMFHVMELS